MASTYLQRTQASGSQTTWTLSYWVKFSAISDNNDMFFWTTGSDGTSNCTKIEMSGSGGDGNFQFLDTGDRFKKTTNRLFRDTSGWYNFVIAVDTTLGTPDDRIKIYVNGVQETSFATDTNPAQDLGMYGVNSGGDPVMIGRGTNFSSSVFKYFDGLMSYVVFVDGQQLAPTAFGEVDSDTGEWKIITSPSVTYGTNGFFILKNGNTITDQSGEGNDFTLGAGTLTDLQDNPDDVFNTMNPLETYFIGSSTITNCSTTYNSVTAGGGSTNYTYPASTLGMTKGKYYAECKVTSRTGGMGNQTLIGIYGRYTTTTQYYVGEYADTYGYYSGNGNTYTGGSSTSFGNSYDVGDVVGIAVDLDNNKLYFSIDGTWQDSGDPTSGATGTGALSITAAGSTFQGCYMFSGHQWESTAGTTVLDWNFGNGYFGTSAIASEGTNASGIGKFEYDVPTGYTALSTKGLNE